MVSRKSDKKKSLPVSDNKLFIQMDRWGGERELRRRKKESSGKKQLPTFRSASLFRYSYCVWQGPEEGRRGSLGAHARERRPSAHTTADRVVKEQISIVRGEEVDCDSLGASTTRWNFCCPSLFYSLSAFFTSRIRTGNDRAIGQLQRGKFPTSIHR